MPDLGTRLREYIDAAAEPITVDEVTELRLDPAGRGRPLRWLAVAAVLLLVGGIVAIVLATRPDENHLVVVGTTTRPEPDWLTLNGAEVPSPPIPPGWKILDFEAVRFAVPSSWITPFGCREQVERGVLVVASADSDSACTPEAVGASSAVRITPTGNDARNVSPARVGTLRARRYVQTCVCPAAYGLPGGLDVTVTGPEAAQVLATFTDSGARRALQAGPVADSSDWREIKFDGVGVLVPAAWRVVDLIAGKQFPANACGGQLFPSDYDPAVLFGLPTGPIHCPIAPPGFVGPGDGVWVRPAGSADGPLKGYRIGGLDVVRLELMPDTEPALDLVVVTPEGRRMAVSIGTRDPSIARAILRSLHRV
jgi:hypothetical protein